MVSDTLGGYSVVPDGVFYRNCLLCVSPSMLCRLSGVEGNRSVMSLMNVSCIVSLTVSSPPIIRERN